MKEQIFTEIIAYLVSKLPGALLDDEAEYVQVEYYEYTESYIDEKGCHVTHYCCKDDTEWYKILAPIMPIMEQNNIKWSLWGDESNLVYGVVLYKQVQ